MSHPPADYIWFARAEPYIVGAVLVVLTAMLGTAVFGTIFCALGRDKRDEKP